MRDCVISLLLACMIAALSRGVAAQAKDLESQLGGDKAKSTTQPTSQPTKAEATLDPRVDKILTKLEKREVKDLKSQMKWIEWFSLNPKEKTIRLGEITYMTDKPVAKFMVHLKKRIVSDRGQDVNEKYLFDGTWYVELNAETKTIIRREVRKPTDPVDPYKLGEGPFPVPFGQKKADILKEFAVELAKPTDKDPTNTDHLVLTPREKTQSAKRFGKVHFWVTKTGKMEGLPIKAQVSKRDGAGRIDSHSEITFRDVELNKGLSADHFVIHTPIGYTETVEPLKLIEPPTTQPKKSKPTTVRK